jgi:hypothetical protein
MGGKKGLAGVTKGMVAAVAGGAVRSVAATCARRWTWGIEVCLDMPIPGCLIQNPIMVIALVATGGIWALHGHRHVLLFNDTHAVAVGIGRLLGGRNVGVGTSTSTRLTSFICGGHGSMKGGKITHHTLVLILFISMHGLSMLTKVIKTRKLLSAMTRKRTFTSVFSDVTSEMLATRKDHTTVAIASALKRFRGCGAVTFIYASDWTRHVRDVPLSDHSGHIIGIS